MEHYREKYGITESYGGKLLRLVSVQFLDEIEEEEVAQVVPPTLSSKLTTSLKMSLRRRRCLMR